MAEKWLKSGRKKAIKRPKRDRKQNLLGEFHLQQDLTERLALRVDPERAAAPPIEHFWQHKIERVEVGQLIPHHRARPHGREIDLDALRREIVAADVARV